jgi:F0F1-type ATP synthase membrane subunit a
MSNPGPQSINVFLTLDQRVVDGYFNKHDPSPIYKRQLSHQFETYIMSSVASAKMYSVIFYKLKCTKEVDKQYTEPLLYAIRRHFLAKKMESENEFSKFKRKNFAVLAVSVLVAIIFHALIPMFFADEHKVPTGLINSLDVFTWVLLWHPIDELMFHWNPHLKDINLLSKLATAESIIIENEKSNVADNAFRVVA